MARSQDVPAYEEHVQEFLAPYVRDANAQAAVFNLDHSAMDVVATMEALALRPHGLTHAGFVMLMTLWITGPRETRQLASVLRVTKGAVTGAVNTLEKRGLVLRRRSDADRRLVTVELTGAGRKLVQRAQRGWHELELEVTGTLSAPEKRQLAALCRKMSLSARALSDSRGGRSGPALPDPTDFLRGA